MLSLGQRKSLELAVDIYAQQLQVNEAVLQYLLDRGINAETARTFHLGFVNQPLDGVGHDEYVGKLVIPYLTPSGPIDLRFRTLDGNGPKYLSRPGSTNHLYNVLSLKKESDVLAVCEGELDTIVTDALVGIAAVGVPGAQNWKPHFARLMQDYERVLILADGDDAGREFGRRLARELDNAVVVAMPEGMDVNDVFLQDGAESIRKKAGV